MKTSKIIFVLAFIAASAFNAAEAFKFKDEVQKQEAAQNPKVEKIEEEIVDDSAVNFGEEAEDEKNREARKIEGNYYYYYFYSLCFVNVVFFLPGF